MLLAEALGSGAEIEAVFAEPGADEAVLARARAAGVVVTEVAEGALRKVLDVVTPQSVVAVAAIRRASLADLVDLAAARGRPLLVLVELQDPGNAGTLVRVAEAAGCAGVVLSTASVDPWNPKAVRASAGSLFRVPVCVDVAPAEVTAACAAAGVATVATVPRGAAAPELVDLGGAVALLVGSEAHGLPAGIEAAATVRVGIPMEGGVESLNAGVAGALLAFEAARQRRQGGDSGSDGGAGVGQNGAPPAQEPPDE